MVAGDTGGRKITINMIVPSWGAKCGVAEYSKALVEALAFVAGRECQVRVSRCDLRPYDLRPDQGPGGVHIQHEYGLYTTPALRFLIATARSWGVPVIITMHDFMAQAQERNELIRSCADVIIVHSSQLAGEFVRLGAAAERVRVIPMGCKEYPLGDRDATRRSLGIGNSPAIGFFGFVLPSKGIFELAAATKLLRRDYPGLVCFIFGSSPFFAESSASEIGSEMAARGLGEGIILRPDYKPLEEVVSYLHAMDVNVLPYRNVGFIGTSSAVRVLMGARRPIITTDVPYFADLQGEVYKIPSADPAYIAGAVQEILTSHDRQEELISRMTTYLKANSWEEVARKHVEVYWGAARAARYAPAPTPAQAPIRFIPGESAVLNSIAGHAPGTLEGGVPGASPTVWAPVTWSPGVPEWMWERVVNRFGRRGVPR
ncbi:MAG: glycosyltransferase [Firmicutes bacterium]|nr:glycosyltransferase [Bacillota bacterium]